MVARIVRNVFLAFEVSFQQLQRFFELGVRSKSVRTDWTTSDGAL